MSVAGRRKRVARLVGSSTESNLFPTAAERLRADWPSPKPSRLSGGGVGSEDARGACRTGKDRADYAVASAVAKHTISRGSGRFRPAAQRLLSSAMRLSASMLEAPSRRRPRAYNSSAANVLWCPSPGAAKPGGCNHLTSRGAGNLVREYD